jgi:hypothetical protein
MRKRSANWYIAMTHFLTAGFIMPFLLFFVFGLLFGNALRTISATLMHLIDLTVTVLVVWIATIYSANFLKKKYIIEDKNKIVNLSTLYLVCMSIISLLLRGFSLWSIVNLIVMIVVFYLASNKYIEETSENIPT